MTAYMYSTSNDGFTANDASFYKKKVGQLHDTLQLQLIFYAINKTTRIGTAVPHYEFAAKQPKKNITKCKMFSVKIKCKQRQA